MRLFGWLDRSVATKSKPRARRREEACGLALETLEPRLAMATLLTGFSESVVATGISNATAMEIAPNGDVWVLEQQGGVKRFASGTTTADVVGNLSGLGLNSSGERGVLGIAFDPDYAANKTVFIYYTATMPTLHNRISAFVVNDTDSSDYYFTGTSTAPADAGSSGTPTQQVIFDLSNLSGATNHNGGAIHFGPDGRLYVAVGDNATGSNAQTLGNLHGKMLRINKDGSIPTDNPFYGTAAGTNRAIWALGLRNPFTFTFQPGSGRMFINDVGQGTWEEINQGSAGANFGWPGVEGNSGTPPTSPGTYVAPFYAYSHGGGTFQGFAITGGAFYNPTTGNFPTEYAGDYFFADFVNNWINVIDTTTSSVARFATGAQGTVDLKVTSNGSLLYLARGSNQVLAIRYTAATAPSITQPPGSPLVSTGQTISLSVTASGTTPFTYQWQRLNGGTWNNVTSGGRISGATSANLVITSAVTGDAGSYRVIVTNSVGSATSSAGVVTVTTNQTPSATININSGLTGGLFIAGQAINFSGTATDPEDGTLGAASYRWRIDFISSINSGNPVVRPFVPEFTGQTSGSFTPATVGPYTLTDVAYRITLTVTDSVGLERTVTRDILPNTATITVTTNFAGLGITVDGQPFTGPHTFQSVVGFERPIGAAATQFVGGINYQFAGWSDGGAATHVIATPLAGATYIANYVASPLFSAKINFQKSSKTVNGYLADNGQAFGVRASGLVYGWNLPNGNRVNRNNPNSPDERYDTHIRTSKNGVQYAWEVALPNGTYLVRMVTGDPSQVNSVFRVDLEGVLALAGKPKSNNRWIDRTAIITVTDGRLTVSEGFGAKNNKLAFLEITQLPAGAAGAYSFNEGRGSNVYDSAGGNTGKLKGGASFTSGPGSISPALLFNGNKSFVAVPHDLSSVLGGSATVSFWMRTRQRGNDSIGRAPGILGVVSPGDGNDMLWGFLDRAGRIGIQAGDQPGAKSAVRVNDDRWHHIVMTRSAQSGEVKLFVDGVFQSSAISGAGLKTLPITSFGRIVDTSGSHGYYNGKLDRLLFYGRVLSDQEIAMLYGR